jgi:hypothetical protein
MPKLFYLLLIGYLFAVSSCMTATKRARQLDKHHYAYEAVDASRCSAWYPIKSDTVWQTRDSIAPHLPPRIDTVEADCNAAIDSFIKGLKPTGKVITPCPPCDTTPKYKIREVLITQENTAKIEALQAINHKQGNQIAVLKTWIKILLVPYCIVGLFYVARYLIKRFFP